MVQGLTLLALEGAGTRVPGPSQKDVPAGPSRPGRETPEFAPSVRPRLLGEPSAVATTLP